MDISVSVQDLPRNIARGQPHKMVRHRHRVLVVICGPVHHAIDHAVALLLRMAEISVRNGVRQSGQSRVHSCEEFIKPARASRLAPVRTAIEHPRQIDSPPPPQAAFV